MKGEVPLRRGDYEIHRAWEGFASIRQISSGEIMHSRTAPMEEARMLYIEQSRLEERLRENPPGTDPLVIWDVGLGAAANAMAAIDCYEAVPDPRPLRLISFENDLDSLRLALSANEDFPHLRVAAANAILEYRHWVSPNGKLTWELFAGDFLETLSRAPGPDVIFYDMFSTKTSASLWTFSTFRKLFAACALRNAELFTYTCSTANRAALLAAGFFIARGRNAGEKLETTIALTPMAIEAGFGRRRELLGADWLGKWNRSAAKFPRDIPAQDQRAFEQTIRSHPQFLR